MLFEVFSRRLISKLLSGGSERKKRCEYIGSASIPNLEICKVKEKGVYKGLTNQQSTL
jgi:hypothetical protein